MSFSEIPSDVGPLMNHADIQPGNIYYFKSESEHRARDGYHKIMVDKIERQLGTSMILRGHYIISRGLYDDKINTGLDTAVNPETWPVKFYMPRETIYRGAVKNLYNQGRTNKNTSGMIGKFLGLKGGRRSIKGKHATKKTRKSRRRITRRKH